MAIQRGRQTIVVVIALIISQTEGSPTSPSLARGIVFPDSVSTKTTKDVTFESLKSETPSPTEMEKQHDQNMSKDMEELKLLQDVDIT